MGRRCGAQGLPWCWARLSRCWWGQESCRGPGKGSGARGRLLRTPSLSLVNVPCLGQEEAAEEMQEGLLPSVGLDHGDGDPNPGDLGPLRSAQAPYDAVVSERPLLCPVSPPLCPPGRPSVARC